MDPIKDFLLEAFSNPERKGCPDEETLIALAEDRLPVDHPARIHIGSCSECFAEYRGYRLEWRENRQLGAAPEVMKKRSEKRKWPVVFALAASLFIVCSAVIWWAENHQDARLNQASSNAVVAAKVDLFNVPTLRGITPDAAPLKASTLPASLVHLTLILPRFSDKGEYLIQVSKDRDGKDLVASAKGQTVEVGGQARVSVTLDLRGAHAGPYFLATIRNSDDGTYYYPLQVVPRLPAP